MKTRLLIASLALAWTSSAFAADPLLGIPSKYYRVPTIRISSCSSGRRYQRLAPPPRYGAQMQQFKWMNYKYRGTSPNQMHSRVQHALAKKERDARLRQQRREKLLAKSQ